MIKIKPRDDYFFSTHTVTMGTDNRMVLQVMIHPREETQLVDWKWQQGDWSCRVRSFQHCLHDDRSERMVSPGTQSNKSNQETGSTVYGSIGWSGSSKGEPDDWESTGTSGWSTIGGFTTSSAGAGGCSTSTCSTTGAGALPTTAEGDRGCGHPSTDDGWDGWPTEMSPGMVSASGSATVLVWSDRRGVGTALTSASIWAFMACQSQDVLLHRWIIRFFR